MNWNNGMYFYEVITQHSLSKASIKLSISQSGLSNKIKQFESDLGEKLFIKNIASLSLTPFGKECYDLIKSTVSQIEELKTILIFQNSLKLGINTVSISWVQELALKIFGNEYIDITFQYGDWQHCLRLLELKAIDGIISTTDELKEYCNYFPIKKSKYLFFTKKQWDKNKKYSLILANNTPINQNKIDEILNKNSLTPEKIIFKKKNQINLMSEIDDNNILVVIDEVVKRKYKNEEISVFGEDDLTLYYLYQDSIDQRIKQCINTIHL